MQERQLPRRRALVGPECFADAPEMDCSGCYAHLSLMWRQGGSFSARIRASGRRPLGVGAAERHTRTSVNNPPDSFYFPLLVHAITPVLRLVP